MTTSRQGGTLIEVMMATLVLITIALAGGAFVVNAEQTLTLHRDRAVAVSLAGSRLDQLRETPFDELTNLVASSVAGTNWVWVKRNGSFWQVTTSSDYESVWLGSVAKPLRTGLQFVNLVSASGQYEGLVLTARVTYRDPDYEELSTIYAP